MSGSYSTVEYANEYFSGRLHSTAWDEVDEPIKEKALQQATKRIERQPTKGRKTDIDQGLAFPRYPDVEVPEAVKEACCEEALALLERGSSQRRKIQAEGVQSFSVGNLSESFVPGANRGLLSQEAKELLRPWLLGAVNIT